MKLDLRQPPWLVELIRRSVEHKLPRLAAAISFNAMFTLSPTLVFGVLVAGHFLGNAETLDRVLAETRNTVGDEAAQMIEQLAHQTQDPNASQIAATIATLILFIGASKLWLSIQDSALTVYGLAPKGGLLMHMIRTRLVALGGALMVGGALIAWVIFDTILQTPGKYLVPAATMMLSLGGAMMFLTLLFAVVYKYVPFRMAHWSEVWRGAAVAGVGIAILKSLIAIYFARTGLTQVYGGAGSLVAIVLTINYTVMIFLVGMELVSMTVSARTELAAD